MTQCEGEQMGHRNKKSLIRQVQERLESMLAIGQSKYEDKKLDLTKKKNLQLEHIQKLSATMLPVRQVLQRQASL